MKLPRDASGQDLAKVLWRDYRVVHQSGSHIILQTDLPTSQRLSVPNHNPLRIGTLNAIIRETTRHKGVDRSQILQCL